MLQLDETKKKASEDLKRAVDAAIDKTKQEIKAKGVDESVVAEHKTKLEASQAAVKQLTEALSELQTKLDASEEETRSIRDKLIKREHKLTAVIQEKAEALSSVSDLTAEATSLRKKNEKLRKEFKAQEESLKMTRSEFERTSCCASVCLLLGCLLGHA